ncbi:nuclear transport factor 2 family protein, partial [Klebsiella pneumoniae]|nr:nuclear transport factor 2 family protein [Klebsiella pneumoniae]
KTAYLATLAEDARVMRVGPQPAQGRAAYRTRIAEGPASVTASHIGGDISKAGDLAFTYGHASWPEAGREVKGHYVRIWQNRPSGWALVVDEL